MKPVKCIKCSKEAVMLIRKRQGGFFPVCVKHYISIKQKRFGKTKEKEDEI